MMKFLALVVIIAVVVCKGETAFAGKGELKKGSARIITMDGRKLEDDEILIVEDAITLARALSDNYQDMADSVVEYIRSKIENEWFCFVNRNKYSDYGLAYKSLTTENSDDNIKIDKTDEPYFTVIKV